ncbi:MAG TPA: hypothetical protein VEG64_04605 [Candidatus Sulfotelmatobacter sp.]|nr:hypothetical protein [Candidatus Sulfotelmatobacter sp.]
MSRIANWGRWPVALMLTVSGFAFLSDRMISIVTEAIYGHRTVHNVYWGVLCSVPFFLSAWGILSWQRWARLLAMALCMVEVVAFDIGGTTGIRHRIDGGTVLATILAGAPLIWAVLPSVRQEYIRRNQPA